MKLITRRSNKIGGREGKDFIGFGLQVFFSASVLVATGSMRWYMQFIQVSQVL